MNSINRRDYILGSSALALSACVSQSSHEIIDTHTHFYDPFRPQGVPWPGKNSSLYRKVTPEEFIKVTRPCGITGTIVVEASSWIEDNQYLLDLASKHKVIYGVVGRLAPGSKDFEKYFKRFVKSSYFKGI
jgi:predicted TIM-barrel fold metal-dependent hydrolase